MDKAGGFVVYRELNGKREFLLLKSSNKSSHWTPPKGHTESSETLLEAAFRELFEETGISMKEIMVDSDFCITLEYTTKNGPKQSTYYLCQLLDPLKQIALSAEHTEFTWIELSNTQKLVTLHDQTRDLLHDSNEYIIKKII